MPRNVQAGLGLGPPAMDPMLHYQLASMYGAGARERLEMELERDKRERELRELREREISDRFKEEMLKNGSGMPPGMGMPGNMPPGLGPRFSGQIDPHWLDLHRRYLFDPMTTVLLFCFGKSLNHRSGCFYGCSVKARIEGRGCRFISILFAI